MSHILTHKSTRARHRVALTCALMSLCVIVAPGCSCTPPHVNEAANPSLRAIEPPSGASQADSDRLKLARLIGVWSFQGTITDEGGASRSVTGSAAGVLENSHFVLLDIKASDGSLAGDTGRKSGSMLFAGEPGKGLTLTAWGDGTPHVRRLIGATNADGSVFDFREMHGSGAAVHVRITFETDDRWTATIGRGADKSEAAYTFTRVE